jgi:uncharacterized membrane protein (DUF441 family)
LVQDNIILLIILSLGLAFNNSLVAAGAGSLLVLKLTKMRYILDILDRRALDIGLLFLLVSVLVPFALDKVKIKDVWQTFQSIQGILAILGGIIAAYMCGQGLILMQLQPEVVVGLVVGTVIGVSLLKGIPVGPLAAAGITALLFSLLRIGKK